MKYFLLVSRITWWLAAAYIPIAQLRFYQGYRLAIACPSNGDCYTPGSEHLLGMELLFIGSAVILWPLCIWYLMLKHWLAFRRAAY
jgi:hypothetical protein